MTQELIFIFLSIFTFSILSFYFGISIYFLSAVFFVQYYPSEQILTHLSILSTLSAGFISIQYFKKNMITKEFFGLIFCFLGGLILNKLVSDQNILCNIYKYRINIKIRITDILAPLVLIVSIISNKNFKYLLVSIMAFTPLGGLYFLIYKLFKNKNIGEEDLFFTQTIILINLITNNLWSLKLNLVYNPEFRYQNLIGSIAVILGIFVAIKLKNYVPIGFYKIISLLILILYSIGALASNFFYL